MAKGAEKKANQRRSDALKRHGIYIACITDFPDTFGGFASLGLLYACYAVAVYGLSEAVASAHASGIDSAGSLFRDLFYVTAATQIGSLYSSWAWLLMLLVPGYGVFQAASFLKNVMPATQGAPPPPDPTTKAGRREARRQQRKQQRKVVTRRR